MENKRKRQNGNRDESTKRNEPTRMNPDDFVSYIERQPLGALVIRTKDEETEPPVSVLTTSAQMCNLPIKYECSQNVETQYISVNGVEIASGSYPSTCAKVVKATLAEQALDGLKSDCFFIYKKEMVSVTNEELNDRVESESSTKPVDQNNAGMKMMLKMGWSGGGLGTNEQGNQDVVKIYQNVSREGIGFQNILKSVTKVLEDHASSSSIATLVFDSSFTKEEREHIHKLAGKYRLKSKSIGSGMNRRITVSKPMHLMNIVRELLRVGGENEAFRLHIPTKYRHLLCST